MNDEFSKRLQRAFDYASMADIARRIGVPHATVRNYFGGRLPAPEVIAADITADLEAALEQFAAIAEDLK